MDVKNTSNHWVLILGGSSGIGLATLKKMVDEGFSAFVVYRERRNAESKIEEQLDNWRNENKTIISFNVDALNKEKQEEVISKIHQELRQRNGKIRLVLHSIARGNLKRLAPADPKEKEKIKASLEAYGLTVPEQLDVEQVKGGFSLTEDDYALTIQSMGTSILSWVNLLIEQNLFEQDARVIGLTSEGNKRAWKSYGAVSAAKVVLEAIARSMAVELAPLGIRTNIIQAGVTDTPSLRMIPGSSEIMKHAILRNPFHRLTTPEDVANVVFLLSTPEAAWINGTIINVDGGEQIA